MTTCVRLCLSYDCFKLTFIALNVELVSAENMTLSKKVSKPYAPVKKCYVTSGQMILTTWHSVTVTSYDKKQHPLDHIDLHLVWLASTSHWCHHHNPACMLLWGHCMLPPIIPTSCNLLQSTFSKPKFHVSIKLVRTTILVKDEMDDITRFII